MARSVGGVGAGCGAGRGRGLLQLLLRGQDEPCGCGEGIAKEAPAPPDLVLDGERLLGSDSGHGVRPDLVRLRPALGASPLPLPVALEAGQVGRRQSQSQSQSRSQPPPSSRMREGVMRLVRPAGVVRTLVVVAPIAAVAVVVVVAAVRAVAVVASGCRPSRSLRLRPSRSLRLRLCLCLCLRRSALASAREGQPLPLVGGRIGGVSLHASGLGGKGPSPDPPARRRRKGGRGGRERGIERERALTYNGQDDKIQKK